MAQYAKRLFEKRTTMSVVVSPLVENYLRTVAQATNRSMSSIAVEMLENAITRRPTKQTDKAS